MKTKFDYIKNILKLAVAIFAIILLNFIWNNNYINFELFNQYTDYILEISNSHYWLSVLFYMSLYLVVKIFAIPVAAFLNILGGFLFGTVMGTFYNNIGSTIGSSLVFLIFRYLLRQMIQEKYSSKLVNFNNNIKMYGIYYLFCITLIGTIPSFIINVLASLTNIPLRVFAATIFIAMIPGSLIYSYVGSNLVDANLIKQAISLKILVFLFIVKLSGLLILFMRKKLNKLKIPKL